MVSPGAGPPRVSSSLVSGSSAEAAPTGGAGGHPGPGGCLGLGVSSWAVPLCSPLWSHKVSPLSLSLTLVPWGPSTWSLQQASYMEAQGSQKCTAESFRNRISTIIFPIYVRELDFISEARVTPHAVGSRCNSISLQNKSVRITEVFTLFSQQILSLSRYYDGRA